MLTSEKLQEYVLLFKNLKEEDLWALIQQSSLRTLKAGEVYIAKGSSSKKLAYLSEGLIRAYYQKKNGDEVTVWLRWEDQFLASYDAILFQKASRFTYVAIEDTILLEADYDVFMQFISDHPKYREAKDYFIFNILGNVVKHRESFLLHNPVERYLNILQENPEIIQRVSDKHLATYLGITPVSLSRIRKRIFKK